MSTGRDSQPARSNATLHRVGPLQVGTKAEQTNTLMRTTQTANGAKSARNGGSACAQNAAKTRQNGPRSTNDDRDGVSATTTDKTRQRAVNAVCADCGGSVWECYGNAFYCVYCFTWGQV